MAESVARVKVQATADLKGLDDAARALKALQQAIAPTDAALSKARLEIIQFGYANKQTEKLIAAQVNALKSLRTEARVGGQLYENLGRDIDELKNKLNGTSTATQKAASSFEQLGKAATSIQNSLQKQGQSFSTFKRQAGETGKAVGELAAAFNIKFDRAGKAIEDAARQVEILKKNASNIGSMFQGPQKGGGLFEIPRKGLADIQAFSQLVKRLKEQSESAYGKVARISEGLFAVGASGAVVGQVANAFGGVSGAIEAASTYAAKFSGTLAGMGAGIKSGIGLGGLKTGLNEISLLLNQPATGLSNLSQSLGKVQQSLDFLNVPAEAFNNALAALGPTGAAAAGVVALALAKVSEEKRKFLKDFEKEATEGLRGITDETQRLINKLAQLSEAFRGAASMNELQALRAGGAARFNETPAGTDASRRAANTIASAEARIKAENMAQLEVLEAARQRYRGTTESVDALSERLAYLQQAMKYVDQSTAEGKAEFAAFSNEANKVKGQIDALSNSYRTVADAIRDAARAQGEYANQGTVNNYLNRAATRQQEELVAAARTALSQPQTPLLPAAGQTSFAGTYGPGGIGGGARMGTGRGETPFIIGTENVGVGTAVYRGAQRTEMEIAGAAAALERDMRNAASAVNNADKAVGELKQAFSELIQPIEKVAKSDFFSPKSINALKARREQIDRERNAVDMLGDDYQRLSRELAKVDKQLERTQPGGLRGKIGYIGQGIGAAASAGIFGGPEGAIGGLLGGGLGALFGGPAGFAAGAFIGSSAGAYAGMGRQQVGQFATYAADISKLEIALKGVTKTQVEYQRALAASASVTKDFNVPQLEATKGITQLSAAVIGAGGKVADAEVVFRNVTAAIKASGGSAEDVQGALTALSQVFSKGKVSAEELQGQLGERLPGAVTMFAKATGRTLPQLQKDLEQGVVGLADLMKFITSDQGLGQFEQRAKEVADSSAEAGARLTTTWNDAKRAIGEALLPLGAQIQEAFAGFIERSAPYFVLGAKAVVSAAQGMFNAISAGFNLIKQFTGLLELATKALIVFGGVQAGVFLATNISTFVGAIKNLIGVMKGLLSIQKVLMAVESARAALLVIIEGLSFGATKGKLIGAVTGGATGLAAAIGIGALIEKVTKDIGAAVQGSIKNIKVPGASELTDFTNAAPGKTDKESAKAEKEQRKAENDLFQKQLSLIEAKLNLLREEGRLTEANSVTEFQKAQDAIELAKNELGLKRQQLALQKQFGKITAAEFALQSQALKVQGDQAGAAYQKAIKDINDKLKEIDNKFFAPGGTLSKEELSPFLQRVNEIRTEIDDAIKSTKKLGGPKADLLVKRFNTRTGADIENIAIRPTVKSLQDQIYQLQNVGREITTLETLQRELGQGWYDMNEPLRVQLELLARQVDLLKEANRFRQDNRIGLGIREGAQQYVESIGTMREATAQLAQTGIKGVEDAIFSLVTTGTANFREFAASILKDTARMIIQQMILRVIMQAIGAIPSGGGGGGGALANFNAAAAAYNANGNAFGRNGIMPFAMGGIVTKPTLFRYANGGVPGTGLMGEAGPEAIIPLRRGRDGKLGVAGGGNSTNVTVNVDASGSSVQGNSSQGEQLGRAISQAVQAELIKQRRPGGLLAA